MVRLVNGLKTNSKEVEEGRFLRGSDGKLCFSEKERGRIWMDYIERIMIEENDWAHYVEGDAIECPVVCVNSEEEILALNEIKTVRGREPSEVTLELIAAPGE